MVILKDKKVILDPNMDKIGFYRDDKFKCWRKVFRKCDWTEYYGVVSIYDSSQKMIDGIMRLHICEASKIMMPPPDCVKEYIEYIIDELLTYDIFD